jgi:hypothetical protein
MNKIFSAQGDWDELLDFISSKKLTPIIGKEMFKFKQGDALVPIDQYLSKQLLNSYQVTDQPDMPLLNAFDFLMKNNREIEWVDLITQLREIVKGINFEFPLLTGILGISDLNYFINTVVYNNILESILGKLRNQKINSINFSLNEPFLDSGNLDALQNPFVFNVFGSLLDTVDPALSEEYMLEYTTRFNEKMNDVKAVNLLNALTTRNLLFLGCAFPDWMVRFILRLLSNQPMHSWGTTLRKIVIVNDPSPVRDAQFEFLKHYRVSTYEGDTSKFANELSNQWKKRNPSNVKNKVVFLSYTVKDRDAVENLKKAIEGINNVSCWYDNREIIPGDEFEIEISKSIRAADLFIPLISENSLMHKDGYVQKEWFTAFTISNFRKADGKTDRYLMPVVIDETNPYNENVPKYFSELSIGKVPSGNPSSEFINQIRQTLKLM